jgi:hypothetical protein
MSSWPEGARAYLRVLRACRNLPEPLRWKARYNVREAFVVWRALDDPVAIKERLAGAHSAERFLTLLGEMPKESKAELLAVLRDNETPPAPGKRRR